MLTCGVASKANPMSFPASRPSVHDSILERLCCVGRLLDDLHELRAFILQRAAENSASASTSLAASMREDLQLWETSSVGSAALQAIDSALQDLCGQRAMQLLMLQARAVCFLHLQYLDERHDKTISRCHVSSARTPVA